jgi:hypothetical protein
VPAAQPGRNHDPEINETHHQKYRSMLCFQTFLDPAFVKGCMGGGGVLAILYRSVWSLPLCAGVSIQLSVATGKSINHWTM